MSVASHVQVQQRRVWWILRRCESVGGGTGHGRGAV